MTRALQSKKVYVVAQNEEGCWDPVLVTLTEQKAKNRYHAIISDHGDERESEMVSDEDLETGAIVKINGTYYANRDEYDDAIAKLYEMDLEK